MEEALEKKLELGQSARRHSLVGCFGDVSLLLLLEVDNSLPCQADVVITPRMCLAGNAGSGNMTRFGDAYRNVARYFIDSELSRIDV